MTMHKIVVVAMLIVSTGAALLYVSTFPVEEARVDGGMPTLMLESGKPAAAPASGMAVPVQQPRDTDALRHLA